MDEVVGVSLVLVLLLVVLVLVAVVVLVVLVMVMVLVVLVATAVLLVLVLLQATEVATLSMVDRVVIWKLPPPESHAITPLLQAVYASAVARPISASQSCHQL